MTTKIFFTDLDGTLLTREKQVSTLTYETLKEWTHAGHKLVLCSGRALDSVLQVRESLNLDFPNMYLIGCNGGEIYDCTAKALLFRAALSLETAKEAFAIAKADKKITKEELNEAVEITKDGIEKINETIKEHKDE